MKIRTAWMGGLGLTALSLGLAGCFTYEESLKLNADGSGEITTGFGVTNDLADFGEGFAEGFMSEMEESVEEINEDIDEAGEAAGITGENEAADTEATEAETADTEEETGVSDLSGLEMDWVKDAAEETEGLEFIEQSSRKDEEFTYSDVRLKFDRLDVLTVLDQGEDRQAMADDITGDGQNGEAPELDEMQLYQNISFEKNPDGKGYKFSRLIINLDDEAGTEDEEANPMGEAFAMILLKSIMGDSSMSFTVDFPSEVTSTNGKISEEDPSIVTWEYSFVNLMVKGEYEMVAEIGAPEEEAGSAAAPARTENPASNE